MGDGDIMQILYLKVRSGRPDSGVNKKVIQQASSLNQINQSTNIIWLDRKFTDHESKDSSKRSKLLHNIAANLSDFIEILMVNKKIGALIKSAKDDVIIYMRYPPTHIFNPLIFSRPSRRCKLVLELNTILIDEIGSQGKGPLISLQKFWQEAFGKHVMRNVDGLIGVTDEITNFYAEGLSQNTKHMTIGNGIDVESVRLRTPPPYDGRVLRLLAVANISTWHAFDRLVRGIADYSGPTEIELHVVGEGSALAELKELTKELDLESKIQFHGFLSGDELDDMFNKCHIAIGSLGLHRKKLVQATPLKSREYCARGIPFVISHADPDFPYDYPYILNFPLDDSMIDIANIVDFAERIGTDKNHPTHMREYAIENLDWSVKMQRLDEFLKEL